MLRRYSLIFLVSLTLCACGARELDPLERLQQPPQIVSNNAIMEEPALSEKNEADEDKLSENLGDKVKLRGKENAPLMTLTLPFEEAWQVMARALKREKIKVTDKDREAGIFLVTYDADTYTDQGFLQSLTNAITFNHYGLRKFKLLVKQAGKTTMILAKDLGAVVKEADPKEGQEEVVDDTKAGPEDGQKRLLHTLYKYLHGGSDESEM